MDELYRSDSDRNRDASHRFADYVRLHGRSKIILVEQEQELLKAGILQFGLTLEQAKSILYGVADGCDAVLESQVEKHIQTALAKPGSRRERRRASRGQKLESLSRQRFETAVDLYQTLTREALSRDEARQRVKQMVRRLGLRARRDWWRLGSRKWYDGIQEPSPASR